MAVITRLHPVLRFADVLLCLLGAAATIVISGLVNPHSASWLVGFYTTIALLFAAVRSARSSKLHRSYALYLFMLALYLQVVWLAHVLVPGIRPDEAKRQFALWLRIFCLGSVYMAVTLFHFTLRFAEIKSRLLYGVEVLGWVASSFFYALNFAGLLFTDFRWGGYTWVPTMGGGYGYFFYLTSFYVTLGILVPLFKLFTASDRQRRLQLFYYLLGGIPLWVSCWGHFLISLGIDIYPAGGVFFLLHAAIVSYAVLKHRVFDISIVVRRGFAYAAVSVILGMVYGLLLVLPELLGLGQFSASDFWPAIFFVLIAGLACAPLLNQLQKIADRVFFRAAAIRQEALERFARETASTVNLAQVAEALCRLLDQCFQPQRVALYLQDSNGRLVFYASYREGFSPANWPAGEQLPQAVQNAIDDSVTAVHIRLPGAQPSRKALQFAEGDDALAVPIQHRQERLGCLVLDPKRADEPYTEGDVQFAETVAAHSSTVLLNARSYAQLERLQLLTTQTLEGLSAGVLLATSSGKIVRSNSAARTICLAQSPGSPATLDELWKLQPILAGAIRHAIDAGRARDNQELCLEGSGRLFVLLSTRELPSQDADRLFLVVLNDITEYREMEDIVRRQESLAKIGEAISAINHEIKNVLQPVRYQVDKLAQLERPDEPTVQHSIGVMGDRLAAMEKLMGSLRDLARPIELRLRRIDLADMADSVWRDFKDTPLAKGVRFSTEIPEAARECRADGHWLRQVLYNLVRNAIEATAGTERPAVCVRAVNGHSTLDITVTDSGCGMDETTQKRLFELFFSTKGESGTGLGLSISRKIVELHGGKIHVESRLGHGTTFHVALPSGTSDSRDLSMSPIQATARGKHN